MSSGVVSLFKGEDSSRLRSSEVCGGLRGVKTVEVEVFCWQGEGPGHCRGTHEQPPGRARGSEGG